MKNPASILSRSAFAAALLAGAAAADAATAISRLNPPSALFSFGDATPPIIARFLPGQRFDLQTTVSPDSGQTITSVQFFLDGSATPLPGTVTPAPVTVAKFGDGSLLKGTVPPAGSLIFTLRAFSSVTPGIHTFTAVATQSDASTISATGNFEVQAIANTGRKAKNIIIMIGDGLGASHRTAARIMKNGIQQGKANAPLSMDLFPVTGLVMTASLNSIITDSAPGAACYSTGNKSNNNQQGVFPDDTTNNGDNGRVELIGEYLARTQGKSLGIVTTSDVFDATPGAFGSHTQARSAGTGICDYYLDEALPKANLAVLLGGGRKWFLPSTTSGSARTAGTDYAYPADVVAGWGLAPGVANDTTRNLLADFQTAGFTYAPDKATLTAIAPGTTKLLGLFSLSNMNVAKDKIDGRRGSASVVTDYGFPDQPMLNEMTGAALQVLNQNPNGFVLMVEGASIDKQAHNMDSERWILDTIEFDYAVERARQFQTANPDTLVLVTADHECAGVAIIGSSTLTNAALQARAALAGGVTQLRDSIVGTGTATAPQFPAVVGTYESASFPQYPRLAVDDGYPATTDVDFKMLIGYASNADRYEDWLTNAQPGHDSQQPFDTIAPLSTYPRIYTNDASGAVNPTRPLRDQGGAFFITGQVADTVAAHTGGDIPISAQGRGAALFTGVQDNTDVFFKAMQAAIGGAK